MSANPAPSPPPMSARSLCSVVRATRHPSFTGPTTWYRGDPHVGEEDLVEVGHAVDLAQRPDLDAGARHRHEEVRDAPVLGHVGIRAGEQDGPLAVLGERRPHLLSVDHPGVTVELGAGPESGEVRSGARLAEQRHQTSSPRRMARRWSAFCRSVPQASRRRPDHAHPRPRARRRASRPGPAPGRRRPARRPSRPVPRRHGARSPRPNRRRTGRPATPDRPARGPAGPRVTDRATVAGPPPDRPRAVARAPRARRAPRTGRRPPRACRRRPPCRLRTRACRTGRGGRVRTPDGDGRAERTRRPPERDDGHGLDVTGQVEDGRQRVPLQGGERGHGRSEAEGPGGQQQVLDGGEDGGGQGRPVGHRRVTARHHQHRGAGRPRLGPGVDVGQQARGQTSHRGGPGRVAPQASVEFGDGRPPVRVADDHEHPGLEVLGARSVGGRGEAPLDQDVVDVRGRRSAGTPAGT